MSVSSSRSSLAGAAGGPAGTSHRTTRVIVGDALARTADRLRGSGSDTPRLDAELLVGFVLGVDRTAVLAHPEVRIDAGRAAALAAVVDRRVAGEPIAYIRGFKEFRGLRLAVDPRVLIPRPETELLVNVAIDRTVACLGSVAPSPRSRASLPVRVWDVGTGSGAVAVAIADALRRRRAAGVRILATDSSPGALVVATANVVAHRVAHIVQLRLADIADERGGLENEPPVDMVVGNLPYVPTDEVARLAVAAGFEPRLALDGGADGLDLVVRLLSLLPSVLATGGTAALEIGAGQAEAATNAAAALLPGCFATVHPDLAGIPRVLEVRPMARD